MTKRHHFRVAGVTFVDTYPDNLHQLHHLHELNVEVDMSTPVILRRNPDNQYDANAIEVHVMALTESLVGHIPKDLAAKVAPVMDEGVPVAAEVVEVAIDPGHPDKPGLAVDVWRAEA